ncbi:MAG: alanine--tRNA ligase [Spartobacteria bacterium]|nr:alanine--tRNA ligase [Spartobacteria bacterium]
MTSSEIRQSFLDFFRSKQHDIVPSSPVVIPADPTLLFANAGMNQFKEYFLGVREPDCRRISDTQKCIRVSGKHNDLEEVGHDTYHHTFFEMLGNWSFGDYYKREVIRWAWELLTDVWKLPKDRLWATVYKDDAEAEAIWKDVTDIDPLHIQRFGEKDNFWEMGETGPCGPCSEIHIDLTDDKSGGSLVNAGSPEVIEIWNLVFIQYNRRSDGTLEELPSKHVDTGMGFERVCAVIQGKKSNYDTDVFAPLLQALGALSGCSYEGEHAIAMRVIADHVRTLSFAIADGVLPSNDGRGYVLRRLLRRAVRYGRKIGFKQPFMSKLVPVLADQMGDIFPELRLNQDMVIRAIEAEEASFASTLDRGIDLFEEVSTRAMAANAAAFPGDEAFRLYDTYGFPYDLTALMASEKGLTMELDVFEKLMQEQRQRARSARRTDGQKKEMDQISDLVQQGISSVFAGYEQHDCPAKVIALFQDGQQVETLTAGQSGQVILDQTTCYAESGGQIGDHGEITADGVRFVVDDTRKPAAGIILHVGKLESGTLNKGDAVHVFVMSHRRLQLQRHHTATHLMNYALRELVNKNIKQAGSYVADDRCRFDFNHFEALSPDLLKQIEDHVNASIMQDAPVNTYEMALKDVPDSGIVAVFDEKYGETVRVVDCGGFSKELCGGTHVTRTGEIGAFRIVSESSVAAGIRRIEAMCGTAAMAWTRREHDVLQQIAHQYSITWEDIPARMEQLQEKTRKMEKELKDLAEKTALSSVDQYLEKQTEVNGTPLLAADCGEMTPDNLRGVMDVLRQKMPSGIIVLGASNGGKAAFACSVSDDLFSKGAHAGKLIGQIARIAGGGGGGQPGKAQAGGKNGAKVPDAIAAVTDVVGGILG